MTAARATQRTAPPAPWLPRAGGAVRIAARLRDGRPALATLHQWGSARALFPRDASGELVAVLLNTAGGLTGGDRFGWEAEAAAGARLTLATQAAERIYRASAGEVARVANRLTLGPGARIDWLPQETILFDGGALERSLSVDMAGNATLLAIEPLVLGRQAMGERVSRAHLLDRWRIYRDGRLVYADTLRLTGSVADTAARPALFGPHRAAATLVYAAPEAADRLPRIRAALDASAHPQPLAEDGARLPPPLSEQGRAARACQPAPRGASLEAGASVREGVLVARLLAPDGRALRMALMRLVSILHGPLSRVWTI